MKPGKVRRLSDMAEAERRALMAFLPPPPARTQPSGPSLAEMVADVCAWLED